MDFDKVVLLILCKIFRLFVTLGFGILSFHGEFFFFGVRPKSRNARKVNFREITNVKLNV